MEQNRATLWRLLIGLLAIALIGTGVWMLFFRDPTPKKQEDKKDTTSLTASQAAPVDSTASRQEVKSQTSPTQPAQSKPNTTPNPQLAKAGPANLTILFVGTSIMGALGHYLCTKRLKQSSCN